MKAQVNLCKCADSPEPLLLTHKKRMDVLVDKDSDKNLKSLALLDIWRILRVSECLLISSLPGKALRTLVDIGRLDERFNMRSQSPAW